MSRTKDKNIAVCSFSEEVVSYLYSEMTASIRAEFESHLTGCDPCTAELADVSFARLDVYEWHRDEFVEMASPRIVIPYGEAATTSSWLDSVRSFFASPARLAMAGTAFAVVTLALGIVFMKPPTEWFVAINDRVPEVVEYTAPKPESEVKVAANTSTNNNDGSVKNKEVVIDTESDPKPVKASVTRNSQTRSPKVVRKTPRITPQPSTARRNAPRLNDFEDEDDDTLRLGDLLAEIGTRDE